MADAVMISNFHKENLVLLLSEGVVLEWWKKEACKIPHFIILKLIEYSFKVKEFQEKCIK